MSVTNEVKATVNQTKAVKLDKETAAMPRVIRNFTYELNDVDDIFTSKISFFLKELNKQLNALVNSNIYTENKEKLDKVIKSKGEFRKELLRLLKTECADFYHKYYFKAEIFGNKAKYFRTVIEEYRRILLSRLHRQTIIDMIVKNPTITYQEVFNKLCEMNERSQQSNSDYKFNWISKAEFNNIIKQLSNMDKLDSSTSKNVDEKQAGEATIDNLPSEAKTIETYSIDYSSEDDQISEFNLTDNDEYYFIEFKLKYSDYTTQSDSLLTYSCKIPKKQIKGLTTGYTKLQKFTRPKIFLSGGGAGSDAGADSVAVAKLYISFNYELSVAVVRLHSEQAITTDGTWQFKTMGIDIGVVKSATSAIITTNMHWQIEADEDQNHIASAKIDFTQPVAISNELTISDKTQSVSKHIEILKNEQNHIYKKEKAIYDLLKLKQSDDSETNSTPLFNKYQRLNKHRLHLRSKVSNLKKELSFLTARDMISHAIDNEVDLITMEQLSWIRDVHHTTWDYSQIQQRIIHEANIYGIKVQKVACAYSSAHNPLTLEEEEVDQNRKLVKCLFDRDYAAAIILARRGVKLGKKKLQQSSHINDSFKAVSYSIKPSLQYRQLKLCDQKSIICYAKFAYYNIL